MRIARRGLCQLWMLVVCCGLLVTAAAAAQLENVFTPVTQPDGTKLDLYASGDEYFHYLHDKAGRIIVQDDGGWFTYARSEDGVPVASESVVRPSGRADATPMGVASAEWMTFADVDLTGHPELLTSYDLPQDHAPFSMGRGGISPMSIVPDRMANLVVFIRFPGEAEFVSGTAAAPSIPVPEGLQAHYGETAIDLGARYGKISDYMQKVSHGSFDIVTSFATAGGGDGQHIVSAVAPMPRGYYQPSSSVNANGYGGDAERTSREMALLASAIGQVNAQIPGDWELDYNGDGLVDNVTFIVSGSTGGWSDLLWPHSWVLQQYAATIQGKAVYQFNFNFAHPQYAGTGVLSHELLHAVGFPDLYRYSYRGEPVGPWDAMGSTDYADPQFLGAYLKDAYAGWANVGTITRSGDFTLWPIGADNGSPEGYRIPTEVLGQSIWVEYRKSGAPGDVLQDNVPSDGLLVYRTNDLILQGNRNGDYPGGNDQVYIFRPGDADYNAGTEAQLNKAALNDALGRTEMGSSDLTYQGTDTLYYNDGVNSGVSISNVKKNTDGSISFHVQLTHALDPIDPDKTYDLGQRKSDCLITRPGTYAFTGSTRERKIIVDTLPEEAVTIVLDGVSIDLTTVDYAAPITLRTGASVTVTVPEGKLAQLSAGAYAAGISVSPASTLTVQGPGRLSATGGLGGAGLGADAMSAGGAIILDGADVTARGGGEFTILGDGYILAHGDGGSAIGCGSENISGPIIIKNSTVDAVAGYSSAIATSYWGLRTMVTQPGGGDISISNGSTVTHQGTIHSGGVLTVENSTVQGAQGAGISDMLLTAKRSVTLENSKVDLSNPSAGGLGGQDPNVAVTVRGGSLSVHAKAPILLAGTADRVDNLVTIDRAARVLLSSTGDTPIFWGYAGSTGTGQLQGNTKGDGVLLQGTVASSGERLLRLLEDATGHTRAAFVLPSGTQSAAFSLPEPGTYRLQDEQERESGPLSAPGAGVHSVAAISFTLPDHPGQRIWDMAQGPLNITRGDCRYIVTGASANAGITVAGGLKGVQLVLEGVDITAPAGEPALTVGDAASVQITVRARTVNSLTGNGASAISAPNADLTLNGSGSLLAAGDGGRPGITAGQFTVDQYSVLTATGGGAEALTRTGPETWTPVGGLEPTVLSIGLKNALPAGTVLTVLGPSSTETITLTATTASLVLTQRERGDYRIRLADGALSPTLSCGGAYHAFSNVELVREDVDEVHVLLNDLTEDFIIAEDGVYILTGEVREGVSVYVRSGVFARIVFDTATLHRPDDKSDPYNRRNLHAMYLEGNCDVIFELRGKDNHITTGSGRSMCAVALSPTAHLTVEAREEDAELHLEGGIGTITPMAKFGQFSLRSGNIDVWIAATGGNYEMYTLGGNGASIDISGGSITTKKDPAGHPYGGSSVGGPGSRVTLSGGKLNILSAQTQSGLVGGEGAQVIISGGEVYAPGITFGPLVGGKAATVQMTGGRITMRANDAAAVGGEGSTLRILGGTIYAGVVHSSNPQSDGILGGKNATVQIGPEAQVSLFFQEHMGEGGQDVIFRSGTRLASLPSMFAGRLRPLGKGYQTEMGSIDLYFLDETGGRVDFTLPAADFWDDNLVSFGTGGFCVVLPHGGTYRLYRDMGTGSRANDLYGGTYQVVENQITRAADITFGRLEALKLPDTTVTYNGGYQTLTVVGLDETKATVTYENNAQKEPGTYTVTAHVIPKAEPVGSNHLPYDLTATFTITKAPLTITQIIPQNKPVYDGTAATTGTFQYSGAQGSDRPVLQGTFTMDSADVGMNRPVTVSDIHLNGIWDSRYEVQAIHPTLLTGLSASVLAKATATVVFTQEDLSQAVGQVHAVRVTANSPIAGEVAAGDFTVTYNGESNLPQTAGQHTVRAVLNHKNYQGQATATLNVGQSLDIGANDITIAAAGTYRITGATTSHQITVTDAIAGDVNLILDNVTIDLSTTPGAVPITVAKSFVPKSVSENGQNGLRVTITAASGTANVLKAGSGASGIQYTYPSSSTSSGILFAGNGRLDVYAGADAFALDGNSAHTYYYHEMDPVCVHTYFYGYGADQKPVQYTNFPRDTDTPTVKARLGFTEAPEVDRTFLVTDGKTEVPVRLPAGFRAVYLRLPFPSGTPIQVLDSDGGFLKAVRLLTESGNSGDLKDLPLKAALAEAAYDLGGAAPIRITQSGVYTITGATSNNSQQIQVDGGLRVELIFNGITVNQTGQTPFLTAGTNTQITITLPSGTGSEVRSTPTGKPVTGLFDINGSLTLKGEGRLTASAVQRNVFNCASLTVLEGNYILSVTGDKVSCLGALSTDIQGGTFDLTVTKKATATKSTASAVGRDDSMGWVNVSGGDFTFRTAYLYGDHGETGPVYCFSTTGDVTLSGGTFRGVLGGAQDGFIQAARSIDQGGRIAIGPDAHVAIAQQPLIVNAAKDAAPALQGTLIPYEGHIPVLLDARFVAAAGISYQLNTRYGAFDLTWSRPDYPGETEAVHLPEWNNSAGYRGVLVTLPGPGLWRADRPVLPVNLGGEAAYAVVNIPDFGYHLIASPLLSLQPVKDLGMIALEDASYPYDGRPKSLAVTGAPSGATVIYQGNGQIEPGTYAVSATVSLDGYAPKTVTADLTITKAALVVSLLADDKAVYDGTRATTGSVNLYASPVAGDVPSSITAAAEFVFDTSDVGRNKRVDVSHLTWEGDIPDFWESHFTLPGQSESLTLAQALGAYTGVTTASIRLPAPATISFIPSTLSQEYDGTPRVVSCTTDPGLGSEAEGFRPIPHEVLYTVGGEETTTAPSAAGRYLVTARLTDGNYAADPITDTLVIRAEPITGITLEPATVTYDGQPHRLEPQGVQSGDSVDYDTAQRDVGVYDMTAVVHRPGCLDLTLHARLTIVPKPVSITGVEVPPIRSGDGLTLEVTGSLGFNRTDSGILGGDEVFLNYTAEYPDANPGVKAVALSDLFLSGAAAGNYNPTFPGSGEGLVTDRVLQSISVTTLPGKTDYMVGERFNPTGMVVTAYYDNGSADVTGYVCTPEIFDGAGDGVTVTVSYTEGGVTKTDALTVTVRPKPVVLASLTITAPPAKTAYLVGERFDPAGMVVTACYDDGTTADVTDLAVWDDTPFTAGGSVALSIRYTEDGATKSTTVTLTVAQPEPEAPTLIGLEVTKPDKTSYTKGDTLSTAGMTVTALYSDGAQKVIATGWTCSPTALDTIGTITITVRYTEAGRTGSATFTVTVADGGGDSGGSDGSGGSFTKPIKPTEPAKEEKPQYPDPKEVDLPFVDLSGHWAREDVAYVYIRGLLKGTGEDRFSPDVPMTRAMFVTVLGRMAAVDPAQYHEKVFEDVPTDTWYGPYVAWGKEQGLVSGRSQQIFAPDEPITRQEIAVLVARYIQYARFELPGGQSSQFTDASEISSWAYDAVDKVQRAGLMRGYPSGEFAPNRSTTRGETAAVLRRLLEQIENVD